MKKFVFLILVICLTIPVFAQDYDQDTWMQLCERYKYVGVTGLYIYAETDLWTEGDCNMIFDMTYCIWRMDDRDFTSHKWHEWKCE